MNKKLFLLIFLFSLAWIPSRANADSSTGMTFLIQNKWGGIHGIALDSNLIPSEPAIVRPNVYPIEYPLIIGFTAFPTGGYQLTALGKILPMGDAKLLSPASQSVRDATALVMDRDESGGWIAAGKTIKTIGRPSQLVFPTFDQNSPIVDIEYDSQGQRLAGLTRSGRIVLCTRSEGSWLEAGIPLKKDNARAITFSPKGFWILSEKGIVYSWVSGKVTRVTEVPEFAKGFLCDIEASPLGEGFYLLDTSGVIHDYLGAPPVPKNTLAPDVAVDLEIIPGNTLPRWDPPGYHTQVHWSSPSLVLDPQGPPKPVSIRIENAEHLTWFMARIRYDSKILFLDPNQVRVGAWMEKGMRQATINASVDPKNEWFILQGSGIHLPNEGASGSGELVQLAAAPVSGSTNASTLLEISEFYFGDAYESSIDHPCPVINSCTVTIAAIQPLLTFCWGKENSPVNRPDSNHWKPGEIVRADLVVENGSRIGSFLYGFHFPKEFLRFLGMTPGPVWRKDVPIQADFGTPSLANKDGGLSNQRIEAGQTGACQDHSGAMVSLFFAAQAPGEGTIEISDIQGMDEEGKPIVIQTGPLSLPFTIE